jgi:glycosyltransferase involved in cell wall biosynthesis
MKNTLPPTSHRPVDISFVAIGYNESKTIASCLESVRKADLNGIAHEIIYVDGGSSDNSIQIAMAANIDMILGGDRRRKAAENRNLGLKNASGRFVQFLDGDMVMDQGWPAAALRCLIARENIAAVCGRLKEVNSSLLYQALQMDWDLKEGEIRHCGGAALWRKEVLEKTGGFPENLAFGEEPFLCWRVRNERHLGIYYLNQIMAIHDLAFRGWNDYISRSIRCGETYAEVASHCYHSKDRLWLKEVANNLCWGACFLTFLVGFVFFPKGSFITLLIIAGFLVIRKLIQVRKRGTPVSVSVSLVYALHVYFSKLPIAWGESKWLFRRLFYNKRKQSK